jgi:hypothetical protein
VLYLSPHLLLPHLGVSSPLGDGWASEPEAQAGAALSPSSRCW